MMVVLLYRRKPGCLVERHPGFSLLSFQVRCDRIQFRFQSRPVDDELCVQARWSVLQGQVDDVDGLIGLLFGVSRGDLIRIELEVTREW